jgi:hypothetical protein
MAITVSASGLGYDAESREFKQTHHVALIEDNAVPVTKHKIAGVCGVGDVVKDRNAEPQHAAGFQNPVALVHETQAVGGYHVLDYVFREHEIGNAIGIRKPLGYVNFCVVIHVSFEAISATSELNLHFRFPPGEKASPP